MPRVRLCVLPLLLPLALLCLGAAGRDPSKESDPEFPAIDPPPFHMVSTSAGVSPHEDIYLLPLTWSEAYNGSETEVVFQLSGKLRILGSRVFLGYTQLSFWQAYNSSASSPFRDTIYNPEVFYRIAPTNSGLRHWGFDFGYEHESNGRGEPRSRSWDRLYVAAHRQSKRTLYYLKAWYRIPEDECPVGEDGLEEGWCRDDPTKDDNPDITDYRGYMEFHYRRRLTTSEKPQQLHLMAHGNLSNGKGGIRLDYSFPARTKDLYWFAMLWHGYGEGLLDYNRSITRIGVGILLRP